MTGSKEENISISYSTRNYQDEIAKSLNGTIDQQMTFLITLIITYKRRNADVVVFVYCQTTLVESFCENTFNYFR